ncbi:hypothetical protein ACWFR1_12425 [Streptomyces sp. NPDC055103]
MAAGSAQETVDPVTGEMRNHRVDPAARDDYENGEKAKRPVRGTKWFFGSGRGDGYWTRVILTFAHVAGGEYEGEASRWYHLLKIPCRHGDHDYRIPVGITTTAEDSALRDAETGRRIPSTTNAASTAPSTSSRPSPTNWSTRTEATPGPSTASSTSACGTAG